jgi:hypothetical protein
MSNETPGVATRCWGGLYGDVTELSTGLSAKVSKMRLEMQGVATN